MQLECQYCRKEFWRSMAEIRRRPSKFCGLICSNKSREKRNTIDGSRWCHSCKKTKKISTFYREKSNYCRQCERKKSIQWYEKNREKALKQRKYGHIRRKYGLTEAQHNLLIEKGCAICGSFGRLVVDHSHINGRMRGVLCSRCNAGLGNFLDDPRNLERATEYLRRVGTRSLKT